MSRKNLTHVAKVIAIISVLASKALAESAASAAIPVTSGMYFSPEVELVKALAWPLVALLIAALFREPISVFFRAIGSRITKLSLFKVEFELVPARSTKSMPLLDDIRTETNPAAINDSSRIMLEQVQSGLPADFAEIAIGDGEEWLTSRLYIAAVMMERMRSVKVFVFVERSTTTDRRFVAVVSTRQLRWALPRESISVARGCVGTRPNFNIPTSPS